jgi:hypothetical protein
MSNRQRAAVLSFGIVCASAFVFVAIQASATGAGKPSHRTIIASAKVEAAWIRTHQALVRREVRRADSARISKSATIRVSSKLQRHFRVLRAVPRAADEGTPAPSLAPGAAAAIATNGYVQVNVAQARFVPASNGGVWVVPGSDGVCVVQNDSDTTTGCGTTTQADNGDLIQTTSAGGSPNYVLGLAPDGNSSVTVAFANGSVESVPVTDNVYEAAGAGMTAVTLTTAAGAHVTLSLLN